VAPHAHFRRTHVSARTLLALYNQARLAYLEKAKRLACRVTPVCAPRLVSRNRLGRTPPGTFYAWASVRVTTSTFGRRAARACVIQGRPQLGRAGCGSRHSWLRAPHGANPTSGSGRHALSLLNCKHFTIPEAGVKITPLGPGSGRKVVLCPAFDETTVGRCYGTRTGRELRRRTLSWA